MNCPVNAIFRTMKSPHKISVYQLIYEEQELTEERLLNISQFNVDGKVVQREQYNVEGNLIKKEKFQYQGELVVLSSEEDLIDRKTTRTICEYQDDRLMSQKEYFNEELSIEMIYHYNDQGQLVQNEILNDDGSLNSRYTYEYLDQKTTERYFDEELTLVRMTETVKNDHGQITEKSITEIYGDREEVVSQQIEYKTTDGESTRNYYTDGIEVYEVIESYDEEGRIIQTITYDVEKDEESVTTVEYDKSGKIIKEEIEKDEELISVTNVVYDEYQNRIELIRRRKLAEDYNETSNYKFVNEYDEEE